MHSVLHSLTDVRRWRLRVEPSLSAEVLEETGQIEQFEEEEEKGKPMQVLSYVLPVQPADLQQVTHVHIHHIELSQFKFELWHFFLTCVVRQSMR